jgi:N-acetyl-gamma-glutamyl-phosphate reductase
MMSVPAVVLGATGYVGGELLRLIATHPLFDLVAAVSESRAGQHIPGTFPHLASAFDNADFAAHDAWLEKIPAGSPLALFSAAPHGASAAMIAKVLEQAKDRDIGVRVVDVSADFRYRDAAAYESVYGAAHGAPQLLGDFVCAVPEHLAGTDTQHVAHPGCFATAILLAAVPLLQSGLVSPELFVTAAARHAPPRTPQQPVCLQGTGTQACAGDHEPGRGRGGNPGRYQFRSPLGSFCARHIRERAGESDGRDIRRTVARIL